MQFSHNSINCIYCVDVPRHSTMSHMVLSAILYNLETLVFFRRGCSTSAWLPVLYTDQPNCPLRLYCPLLASPARCLPLFLPAVCPCWAVYRCGWRLSIAAAVGGVLVRLNLRDGTARTFPPACVPAAGSNLPAGIIGCVLCGCLLCCLLCCECGFLGCLLCFMSSVCHCLLCCPSNSNNRFGAFG